MAVYRHTCPLKALQRDLPMLPAPTDFTGDSFLLTYLFVLWVCEHEKRRRWTKQSKQYNPVSAAIMQKGHTTVFPKGSHEDGGTTSHVGQGMTPDFQICHLYWLRRWNSEAGQHPSAARNWRKHVKRSLSLLLTEALQLFITLLTSHL